MKILSTLQSALTDRKGVTAAEYAVLAAGIVLSVSAAAALLGPRIATTLGTIVP